MLRPLLLAVLLGAPALAQSNVVPAAGLLSQPASPGISATVPPSTGGSYSVTLFDNGPIQTGTGNGALGSDTSLLETGLTVYGFNDSGNNYRILDDFTVPAGRSWTLTTGTWFEFQVNSPLTVPPPVFATVRIWSGGAPNTTGTILAGNTTSNRLMGAVFSNIYRVDSTNLLDGSRPLIKCTLDLSFAPVLGPGTYWIDVNIAGYATYTGPYAPPKTPRAAGDNALQYRI